MDIDLVKIENEIGLENLVGEFGLYHSDVDEDMELINEFLNG